MSDQDRIFPNNIYTKSSRQVIRIEKISIKKLLVDPLPNSPNYHHEKCMADSKENYKQDLTAKLYMHLDLFLLMIKGKNT